MEYIDIKSDSLHKAVEQMNCEGNIFGYMDGDDFHFPYSSVPEPKGYELPKNKETGIIFPNCCPYHKGVFESELKWFDKFPNCCKQHREMSKKWWFVRDNYNTIAKKIVTQLSYTEHLIFERIDKEDWFKNITQYFEYNFESFGHPSIGAERYAHHLKWYIKNNKTTATLEKREALIEYIEDYSKPANTKTTDLNVLYQIYQKWLKIFPFELSMFNHLKTRFEKNLPIIKGTPETNQYTGKTTFSVHTKESLFEVLIEITNTIITSINVKSLYDSGNLTDFGKIKLELLLSSRQLKINQGYKNNSSTIEQRYRKMLKEWFEDEQAFINELEPLLNQKTKELKNYKDEYWFIIGLHFATGKIHELLEKHHHNFTQVAIELGNKNYRPFISESKSNTNKKDKNIFSSKDKLKKIQIHCTENKIPMVQDFLNKINGFK